MHRKIIPDIIGKQDICSLAETSTVQEAAQLMGARNIAAMVVTDDMGRLSGIFTERDITRRVVAQGIDPKTTALSEVMTQNPDTLAPDDSAMNALELMHSREIRHLPVVDDSGIVGMVSIRDLYSAVKEELEEDIAETQAFVFGNRYGA